MDFILLADFSVIRPEPGLIIWTTLIFFLFWTIMGRFAFRPIQNALKQREDDIQGSLDEAKRVREEMANLKAENEEILKQAYEERAKIVREAKEAKDSIIKEAKDTAKKEAKKIVSSAKQEIENQKMAAITEVKNQMGMMALEIAEKVLRKELQGDAEQEAYVNKLMKETKFN